MAPLKDFYRGDTKRWLVTFEQDITGGIVTFRMAKTMDQAAPDLQIVGVVEEPSVPGNPTYSALMTITAEQSDGLAAGTYTTMHHLALNGDSHTFNVQALKVLPVVPKNS